MWLNACKVKIRGEVKFIWIIKQRRARDEAISCLFVWLKIKVILYFILLSNKVSNTLNHSYLHAHPPKPDLMFFCFLIPLFSVTWTSPRIDFLKYHKKAPASRVYVQVEVTSSRRKRGGGQEFQNKRKKIFFGYI